MNTLDPFASDSIDYETAFEYIEHEATCKTLRTIGINEAYITILEDIHTGATARAHVDNQISEKMSILRDRKQEDPIVPKLFTSTVQEVCTNAQPEEKGINIDGEKLSDLRFADNAGLTLKRVKDMEYQLNTVNEESLKIGLKIHKENPNF